MTSCTAPARVPCVAPPIVIRRRGAHGSGARNGTPGGGAALSVVMDDPKSASRSGMVDDASGARRLLERVARGDREAFQAFYERYGARVMALLRRRVAATGIAAELVQDVFVAVWLGASNYRGQSGEPERWLLGIVHHKLQDYWRRQTRELVEQARRSGRPKAARPDADDRLTVEEALARLSADQQRVLGLIYRDGLTFAEAARALCMPIGTVKSRVHTALSTLRAFFEPT